MTSNQDVKMNQKQFTRKRQQQEMIRMWSRGEGELRDGLESAEAKELFSYGKH